MYQTITSTGVFENDHALFGEQKRNTAACTEVTAELVEVMANVASRPVFIVGQAFYDDSNAVRAIAFIDDGFIVVLIAAAGSLLNDTVDVIVWYIVGLCFCNQVPQLCIAARVSTALFDADDVVEISCDPSVLPALRDGMTEKGYHVLSAEVEQIPATYTTLTDEDQIKKMNLLLEHLEENDDVQNVYHNWSMPEDIDE